jgi:PPM family protein phosphatase
MELASDAPRVFLQLDQEGPERISFAGGSVTVLSSRCPGKETPNEDGAVLIPCGEDAGVLAVADGAGGMPDGEKASRLALQALAAAVSAASPCDANGLRGAILDGIEQANRAVLDLGTGAMTTLAVVELRGRQARPYHVGDSGVLICGQRGKLRLHTIAHSPTGYGLEAGLLDEQEAVSHEERHLVLNLLGHPDMRIEVGSEVELRRRDTLVVMSDGVSDNFYLEEVVEHVRKGDPVRGLRGLLSEAHERMVQSAPTGPSHADDLTVLLFRPG